MDPLPRPLAFFCLLFAGWINRQQQALTTLDLVFGGAAALLAIVAVIASWIPAHAATKVDPLDAVRRT